jgi:hypothetical protein
LNTTCTGSGNVIDPLGKRIGRVLLPSLDVADDSSSHMAFERAASWLKNCVWQDSECKPEDLHFMPRRLLNVGSNR